ncbi:MAG: hypothetical protein JXA13_11945 [Anaerolineales bacterium]|nr:hypothetical protein [Anaerolineales bacterium]
MSKITRSSLFWLFLTIISIAVLTLFGPEDKSLGTNVRIIYLHGSWVVAAELAFFTAAIAGLIGLFLRHKKANHWSAALGRTGVAFWITYLPMSLWAMQANWNGLFLVEPRFRLALIFAVIGLLIQIGLWLLGNAWLISLNNIIFIIMLRVAFSNAANVMHPPPSPIFNSGNWEIIVFFIALNILTLVAAGFTARTFLRYSV